MMSNDYNQFRMAVQMLQMYIFYICPILYIQKKLKMVRNQCNNLYIYMLLPQNVQYFDELLECGLLFIVYLYMLLNIRFSLNWVCPSREQSYSWDLRYWKNNLYEFWVMSILSLCCNKWFIIVEFCWRWNLYQI